MNQLLALRRAFQELTELRQNINLSFHGSESDAASTKIEYHSWEHDQSDDFAPFSSRLFQSLGRQTWTVITSDISTLIPSIIGSTPDKRLYLHP